MKITKDIKFVNSGGMLDLFDNAIKAAYNLTDDEYDFIAGRMTDQEMTLFVNETPTFTQKREILGIRAKYLAQYHSL